ncbi:serine-rich adhesin for platelets-like isoform X2 [Chelonus insularis]|uniref:serine-rich adhesin for platelets-like isoform X2 n=1 Tax=Chelonus insularis TaxID=460826 RepID=UPI00158B7558|nr:serine-rich adhesin for platelets-like isoform X2 [Chelonus insularis]
MKAHNLDQKIRGVIMLVSFIMASILVEGAVINREGGEDHGEGHSRHRRSLLRSFLGDDEGHFGRSDLIRKPLNIVEGFLGHDPVKEPLQIIGGGGGGGGYASQNGFDQGFGGNVRYYVNPSQSFVYRYPGQSYIPQAETNGLQTNFGNNVGVNVNAQHDSSLIGRIFGGKFLNSDLLSQGNIIQNLLLRFFGRGSDYARYNERIPSILDKIRFVCKDSNKFLKNGHHEREYDLLKRNIALLIYMKQNDGDQFYEKNRHQCDQLFEDINRNCDLIMGNVQFGGSSGDVARLNFLNLGLTGQLSFIKNQLFGLLGSHSKLMPEISRKLMHISDHSDVFFKDGRHGMEYGMVMKCIGDLLALKQKDGDQFYEKNRQQCDQLFEDINRNCDLIMGNVQFGGSSGDVARLNFLNLGLTGQLSFIKNQLFGLLGSHSKLMPEISRKLMHICDHSDVFFKDGRHGMEYGMVMKCIGDLLALKQKDGAQFYEKNRQQCDQLFEDINRNCDLIMGNGQFGGSSLVEQAAGGGYDSAYANEDLLAQITSWIHQFDVLIGPGRLNDPRCLLYKVSEKLRHLEKRHHLKRGLRQEKIRLLKEQMSRLLSWTQRRGYGNLESDPQFAQLINEINSNVDNIDDGNSDFDGTQPGYTQYKEQLVDENSKVNQVPHGLDLNPRTSAIVSESKTTDTDVKTSVNNNLGADQKSFVNSKISEEVVGSNGDIKQALTNDQKDSKITAKGVKRSVDVTSGAGQRPYIDPKILEEVFGSNREVTQSSEVDEQATKEISGESLYQSNVNNQDDKKSTKGVETSSTEHIEKSTDNESVQNKNNKQSVSKFSSSSTSNDNSNVNQGLKDKKPEESVKVVGMKSDASNGDVNNLGLITGGNSESASSSHNDAEHQTYSGLDLVGLEQSKDSSGQNKAVEEKKVTKKIVEIVSKQNDETSDRKKSLGDNKHEKLTDKTSSSRSYSTSSSSSSNDQNSKGGEELTNHVHVNDNKKSRNDNSENNGHKEYLSHQSSSSDNTKTLNDNGNLENQVLKQSIPDISQKAPKTNKQGSETIEKSSWSSSSSSSSNDQEDQNSGLSGLKQSVSVVKDKEVSGSNEHENGSKKRSGSSSYTSSTSDDGSEGQDSIVEKKDLNQPIEKSGFKKDKKSSSSSYSLSSSSNQDDQNSGVGDLHLAVPAIGDIEVDNGVHLEVPVIADIDIDNSGMSRNRNRSNKKKSSTSYTSSSSSDEPERGDSIIDTLTGDIEQEGESNLIKPVVKLGVTKNKKLRSSRYSSSSSNGESEDPQVSEMTVEEEPEQDDDDDEERAKSSSIKSSKTSYRSSSSSSSDQGAQDSVVKDLKQLVLGKIKKRHDDNGVSKNKLHSSKTSRSSFSSSSSNGESEDGNTVIDTLNGEDEQEEEDDSIKHTIKSGLTKHKKSIRTSYSSSSSNDQDDNENGGFKRLKPSVSAMVNKGLNSNNILKEKHRASSKTSKTRYSSSLSDDQNDDSEDEDSALDEQNEEEEKDLNKSVGKSGITKHRKSSSTSYSSSSSSDQDDDQNDDTEDEDSALDEQNGEDEEEGESSKSIRKSGITKHKKSSSTSYSSSSSSSDQGDQHSGVQGQHLKQSVSLSRNKEVDDVKPLEDLKSTKEKTELDNKLSLSPIIKLLTIVNEKGIETLTSAQKKVLSELNSFPGLESVVSKLT